MLQITLVLLTLVYIVFACKHRAYLTFFYNFCFLLPCMPLINAVYGQDSAFWTGKTYTYSYDSLEVTRLTLICIASVTAAITIHIYAFATRNKSYEISIYKSGDFISSQNSSLMLSANNLFSYLGVVLVVIRLIMGNGVEQLLSGYELLTTCLILFLWVPFIVLRKTKYFIIPSVVTCIYAYSQILTGDRDFFVIVISLVLFYISGDKVKFEKMLIVMPIVIAVIFIAAIISMVRMDVDLNAEMISEYLTFNSWNATIQPVLTMLPDYWYSDSWLYGKTYIDLILSAAPSPLYSTLGIIKPITLDNPADWFYVVGMGGMHAAGVAIRNFGLYGVFLQGLFLNWIYFNADKMRNNLKNFKEVFLYLILASSVMHTTWYGLITLLNAFVLYLFFIIVIYVIGRLNLKSDLKFGEKKCAE